VFDGRKRSWDEEVVMGGVGHGVALGQIGSQYSMSSSIAYEQTLRRKRFLIITLTGFHGVPLSVDRVLECLGLNVPRKVGVARSNLGERSLRSLTYLEIATNRLSC